MKNNLNESTYAVEVMSESEMTEVNGGLWGEVAAFIVSAVFQWGFAAGQEDRAKNK